MPFVAQLVEITFHLNVELLWVSIKLSDTYVENKQTSKC